MPRNTSNFAMITKPENISWVIAENWLTQELPSGLNPDWFSDMRFFPIRYGKLLFKNFARDREKRGRSVVFNTKFFVSFFLFRFFVLFCLRIDTFALFHFDGKMPCVRHDLKIILRGLQMDLSYNLTMKLREKSPNTEFFLVRVFPHSDWIWGDTEYLSVFSPNARKYGPEKTPYLDTFHTVWE